MLLDDLEKKGLIKPPQFLANNTVYLTIMGSHAYGCADTANEEKSDWDIYGIVIPPKQVVFPHLAGEIFGFGKQKNHFEQFLANHIIDPDALGGRGREYDLDIFNIVKFFSLLMDCNPNILDSIFTSQECVLHITQVGVLIREHREIFLHKGVFHRMKGYAYSQLHKMTSKNPVGKRKDLREEHGFDVKFGMNVIRLLLECEQILAEGTLDLRRHSEHLKAIRRGDIPEEEIRKWASDKEKHLEKLYEESKLPWGPDEERIKQLLLKCLEHHYGSLDKAIVNPDKNTNILMQIRELANQADI